MVLYKIVIDRQPNDVPIGHAIPVPGGVSNDRRMKNGELGEGDYEKIPA